jgi:hypothetical protein
VADLNVLRRKFDTILKGLRALLNLLSGNLPNETLDDSLFKFVKSLTHNTFTTNREHITIISINSGHNGPVGTEGHRLIIREMERLGLCNVRWDMNDDN